LQFTLENIILWFFAVAAVVTAILMITRRSPVTSVIYLVANFFCISVMYLFLKAQFIAIIQILVYAGAIMVLFLFVIMLLNLQEESKLTENITYKKISTLLLVVLFLNILSITVYFTFKTKMASINPGAEQLGTIESIGKSLYTTYSFPFEIVSFILLAAIIGAIVLAKKKFE
jgi:NADH-quinone oxidoreductase subunit J